MLRLLFLFLILRCAAVTSEDTEELSSGDFGDQEEDDDVAATRFSQPENAELDKSKGGEEETSGGTMIIIVAAASVVALTIVTIAAIFLIRRYLRSKEQGVYSMPAEQGEKAAV